MFSPRQLIKNYDETDLLNEQDSPQGFVDEHLLVTRLVISVPCVKFAGLTSNASTTTPWTDSRRSPNQH
jgi:hypothetical protein